MAYKKPIRTSVYVKAYPTVRTRIKIPQPIVRPLQIVSKDLIKKELLNQDPWWYTKHRRGIRRTQIGIDPLEARATPKEQLYGTLPERIVYKYLTHSMKLVAGIDFDFQSSQAGGRMELGGLVADFLFEIMRIVIQVQGPTHATYLRAAKDEEQKGILESMGYRVFDIEEVVVYSEPRLEDWMRRTFGMAMSISSGDIYVKSPGANLSASSLGDPVSNVASFEEEYEDEYGMENLRDEINNLSKMIG
jgi:hypothetical protein